VVCNTYVYQVIVYKKTDMFTDERTGASQPEKNYYIHPQLEGPSLKCKWVGMFFRNVNINVTQNAVTTRKIVM